MHFASSPSRRSRRGFSLVELLVVISIIAIISTISIMGLGGLSKEGAMTRSVGEVRGLMDYARQYAITRNTYVWVAYQSAEDDGSVVLIESTTGADPIDWSTDPVDVSSHNELRVLGKIEQMSGVRLLDAGNVAITGVDSEDAHAASTVDLRITMGTGNVSFDRAVLFAPTGEVRISGSGSRIEIGIQPVMSSSQEENVALVQLTSATGQVRVHRPQL